MATNAQEVEEVLEKYYAFVGGKDKVFNIRSAIMRATSYSGSEELDSAVTERKMLFPYYESTRTFYRAGNATVVNNSEGHYITVKPGRTLKNDRKEECNVHPAHELRRLYNKGQLSLARDSLLFGKQCSGLQTGTGRNHHVYYFAKSGMLVAKANPTFQQLSLFSDYRIVQGVLYPFTSEFFSPQNEGRQWSRVTFIEFDIPLTPADFNLDDDQKRGFRKVNSPFNKIDYLANGVDDLTFHELIKDHFAGKRILIDLWATWCMPCHIDFQYLNDEFYNFMLTNGISLVFISVDKSDRRSQWQTDVEKFNINGYHLLAPPGSTLYDDVVQLFFRSGTLYIPKYILVNEKGEILSVEIKRPSDEKFQEHILWQLGATR